MNHYRMKAEGGHIGATRGSPAQPVAELTIKLQEAGVVHITGPLNQKELCMDMLTEALKIVASSTPDLFVSNDNLN